MDNSGFNQLFEMFGKDHVNNVFNNTTVSANDLPKSEVNKDICSKCGGEYIQMMDRKKCDTCGRIVEVI